MLTWSENCVIRSNAAKNQVATFEITDTKLYVLAVTLTNQDYKKLLQQLKSIFKRIISLNKHQSKTSAQKTNI